MSFSLRDDLGWNLSSAKNNILADFVVVFRIDFTEEYFNQWGPVIQRCRDVVIAVCEYSVATLDAFSSVET